MALDNQISQLTREQRDVQRVADNAALELAKVKDSLSNAEVEDNMYASRLEQIDEQLEEEVNATDMVTKMKLFGSDAKSLYELDQEYLARTYSTPSPLAAE